VARVGLKEGERRPHTYEALGAGKARRKMEPFLVRLKLLADRHVARNTHEGEEFLTFSPGDRGLPDDYADVLSGGRLHLLQLHHRPPRPLRHRDREAVILAVIYQGK
jgi:hypothetical protein